MSIFPFPLPYLFSPLMKFPLRYIKMCTSPGKYIQLFFCWQTQLRKYGKILIRHQGKLEALSICFERQKRELPSARATRHKHMGQFPTRKGQSNIFC